MISSAVVIELGKYAIGAIVTAVGAAVLRHRAKKKLRKEGKLNDGK